MFLSTMPFSDTVNKTGLIQFCEDWCGLGDGAISGDATQLAKFAARINQAFDRVVPMLLSFSDHMRWDDSNHTDQPIATFDIVSGQSDYTIKTDANSLNILNIVDVQILPSASSTLYVPLNRITLDDYWAPFAMSPNPGQVGTPTGYVENGNKIFLFVQPNYACPNGVRIFFERDPAYFVAGDTTKVPGIPRPFHGLLALYAAYDYILQTKSSETVLITRLEAQISRREKELRDLIGAQNPTHASLGMKGAKYI